MTKIAMAVLLLTFSVGSNAQAASTEGSTSQSPANDADKVPARGVLPSAGGGPQTGAPGMQVDCQKDPKKCSDPVKNGAASSPGLPTQSK
jgi:hypothetical protein